MISPVPSGPVLLWRLRAWFGSDPSRQAWAVAAASAVAVAGFVVLRLVLTTPVGGFVTAGGQFTDPAAVPPEIPVTTGRGGYDGQYVYRLALEPWTTDAAAHGIRLDLPGYRQQRIATALLAWMLAMLPGISTELALVLVNMLALVVAAWHAARLVADAGRHPAWALALAAPACMPISLGRDLTEPLAWAAILAGLWHARQRHWATAAAALTLAVLARETSLLIVIGLLAAELTRRRGERAPGQPGVTGPGRSRSGVAWMMIPIAVAAAWQLWLWHVWGDLPMRSGPRYNLGDLPVLGVLESIATGITQLTGPYTASPIVGMVWAGERLALLLILGYAAVALVRQRSRVTRGERIAWALTTAVALSLAGWSYDVQFLRATYEALGMSLLVAVFTSGKSASAALALAGGMTAGVAVTYVLVL